MIYGVISQRTYPGVGDVDDCSIVATFWAARAAGYRGSLPTVEEFRAAAGVPDRPGKADGLTNTQVWAGIRGTLLRHLSPQLWTGDWDGFAALVRRGYMASLAVASRELPADLRFGFLGAHRIGVGYDRRYVVANPLAPNGSAPLPCNEATLRQAALVLGGGTVQAALFPPVSEVPDVLPVTDPTPKTVDIPVGKQLYDLAGIPKVKVSTAQNDVYSPFRSGTYRAVVVVTGGTAQLLLVRAIDVDDSRPIPTDKKVPIRLEVAGSVVYDGQA